MSGCELSLRKSAGSLILIGAHQGLAEHVHAAMRLCWDSVEADIVDFNLGIVPPAWYIAVKLPRGSGEYVFSPRVRKHKTIRIHLLAVGHLGEKRKVCSTSILFRFLLTFGCPKWGHLATSIRDRLAALLRPAGL